MPRSISWGYSAGPLRRLRRTTSACVHHLHAAYGDGDVHVLLGDEVLFLSLLTLMSKTRELSETRDLYIIWHGLYRCLSIPAMIHQKNPALLR
jgi:hypothetical protein